MTPRKLRFVKVTTPDEHGVFHRKRGELATRGGLAVSAAERKTAAAGSFGHPIVGPSPANVPALRRPAVCCCRQPAESTPRLE
jgi:hypothetical protein